MSEGKVTVTSIWIAILALLVLTVASFGASFLSLGAWEMPVALGIAAAKVALVGLYFMDLRERRGSLRLLAVVGPVFVIVFLLFTVADVWTR